MYSVCHHYRIALVDVLGEIMIVNFLFNFCIICNCVLLNIIFLSLVFNEMNIIPTVVLSSYSFFCLFIRPDSSLLSSFFSYNYWLLAGETPQGPHSTQKSLSPSDVKLRNSTVKWIQVQLNIIIVCTNNIGLDRVHVWKCLQLYVYSKYHYPFKS